MMKQKEIRIRIHRYIKEYFDSNKGQDRFVPGKTKIGVGFPSYDHKEVIQALDSLLELRLSQGEKVKRFERDFADYIGVKYAVAVNSGSSANLLALSALLKAGKLKSGSEVIAPAATFTTVISPILQNGLVPNFVDIKSDTYNIDPHQIKKAINAKTGLILAVHSLGCPADIDEIMDIARKNHLPVMEDCCEAHGAAIEGKRVGSFGLISTYSFFVAHNITTGEGGMIMSNNSDLNKILRSIREFGRLIDQNNNRPRFYYSDEYLHDYDERYVFKNIGYNMRMTDLAASLGIEQLKKLGKFNEKRVANAKYLNQGLKKYEHFLVLPQIPQRYFHSFYGYTILIRENPYFSRKDIVRFLEEHKIETRAFMGGNLALQPAYRKQNFKISGKLENTTRIMNNAFFIGCFPGIGKRQLEYIVSIFDDFFKNIK